MRIYRCQFISGDQTDSTTDRDAGLIPGSTVNLRVENSTFGSIIKRGVVCSNSTAIEVNDHLFTENLGKPLEFSGATYLKITDNIFYDCNGTAIQFADSANRTSTAKDPDVIAGNVIVDTGQRDPRYGRQSRRGRHPVDQLHRRDYGL